MGLLGKQCARKGTGVRSPLPPPEILTGERKMEKKLIEIISVGHNETCVLSFPGSSEEMTFTADEVGEMFKTLSQACYTMGFKSGRTPEEYGELTGKISEFIGLTQK